MSNFIKVLLASIALLLPSLAQASEEGAPMDVEGSVRIDLEQGMSLWEEEAVFLDVRPESNFEAGRIPGAVNLHVDSALTQESIATVVAQDAPLVVYCNGVKCGLSAKAIPMLVSWGYTNILYLREGYPGWEQAGFPIE